MRKAVAAILILISVCGLAGCTTTDTNVEDGIAVLYDDEWRLCIPEDLTRTGT